jgi:iron complex outermembrane recepter protein
MKRASFLSPFEAASFAVAACLAILPLSPAFAQDELPPEEAVPADAAAIEEAAPAEAPATETVETIPVDAPPQKAPAGSTQLDTIQVTGSRLKRTDYESAQPVVSISREDIERTGLTDISDILRKLSVAGNNSLSPSQGRFALSSGEVNLDLRNLGASHTLLLVNGRRWVTGLISTQPSVSDYNTIPTSIIERVEILKDGASAIYGSDAIGGVVNVITRKEFQGGNFSYQLGQFVRERDGTNQQLSFDWGMTQADSSLFVNLSYTDQDRAPNEARELTASPANGIVRQSAVTTRGTYILITPNDATANFYGCPAAIGASPAIPGGAPVPGGPQQVGVGVKQCTLQRNVDADPNSSTQTDYHQGARTDPNPDPNDVFNRFGDGSLTQPNERTAVYTQYSHRLFDSLDFGFEGLYNLRESSTVGQRGYIGGGDRLFLGSESYRGYIPEAHPGNPFGQDIGWDNTCADQADPTCQHLGTGTGLWAFRLGGDADNQNFHQEVQTLRLGANLSGGLDLLGLPLSWSGGHIYSRNKMEELFPNARFDLIANALQNGQGTPTCVAPCAPLDVFHGRQGITDAAINYIFYSAYQRSGNSQEITFLDLNFDLPYLTWLPGPIAMATGLELRRDEYSYDADPVFGQGLVFMNRLTNTAGSTSSREAYLEFGLPLAQNLPLVQTLELDLAGRYSKYPTFGDVTTGKAGLRWKPFDDLLVRGTYSTGFRAPNIGELFNGASQSFDGYSDPCVNTEPPNSTTNVNCTTDQAQGGGSGQVGIQQPYGLWQGNPDLDPEKSVNITYGLVYSPSFVPDLNLNLDFYDIKIEDFITIGGIVGQYFLDSCYKTPRPQGAGQNSGPFCDKVHRDGGGTLQFVDVPWFNLAGVETRGIDGGFDYLLPLPARFGRFKLAMDASYLVQYDTITPGINGPDQVTGNVGTDSGQFSGYPRWKAGGVLSWSSDVYSLNWSTRMAYHMREPCADIFDALDPVSEQTPDKCSDPSPPVADDVTTPDVDETYVPYNQMKTVFYHDLQFGRELPIYNGVITLGVRNVFDQDPPISRSNIGIFWYNYDPNHYEAPGRFGYLKVGFKF